MLPRVPPAPFLAAVAIVWLASCARDDAPAPDARTAETPAALLEVPRPDPATMETDVAALMDASWAELVAALADADLAPGARAEAYAAYGLAAFGNGLVIPAEAAFENATRLAPEDARWIYFLALVHEFTGMLDESAAGLERVLELRPDDLPALIRLGDVRFEQARMDDARAAYRRALEVDGDSAAARYGLGRVADAEGEHLEAVGHYEAALDLQPFADRLNYLLGLAWRNLGEPEKAEAYLAQRGALEPGFTDPLFDEISGGAARIGGLWTNMIAGSQAFGDGDYALAVEQFRLATQDHPDDPRSWQSLGMALNRIGDRDGAVDAYLQSLGLADENAAAHHSLAGLLIGAGRLDDAERHLMRAIAIDPQRTGTHAALARLLADTGRIDEALRRYDEAVALDPQSGELAVSRARTLAALGRLADAVAALAEAVRVNPRDATIRLAYALMLADAARFDEAIAEIEQVLAIAEDAATRGRAQYALGRVHLKRGDGRAAIRAFDSAFRSNPDHLAAGMALARTYLRARDFERAFATYRVIIRRWPENDAARVEAATAAVLDGSGADARRVMEAGAESESASPRLLGSLARLLVLSTEIGVRDPDLALVYARRATEKSDTPPHLETLALCLSALSRFDEAVQVQERLLDESGERVAPAVRARIEENLQRYRMGNLGRLPFDAS